MPVFDSLQISLELTSGISFKKKQELRKIITDNGGTISYIVNRKSNYVVTTNQEKAESSYKCRAAHKLGIPVVSTDFILDSQQEGQLCEPDKYILIGQTKIQQLGSGRIATKIQPTSKKKRTVVSVDLNKIETWSYKGDSAPSYTSEYNVVKCSAFQKLKAEKGQLVLCILELHVDVQCRDEKHKYRVYQQTVTLKRDQGELYCLKSSVCEVRHPGHGALSEAVYAKLHRQLTEQPLVMKRLDHLHQDNIPLSVARILGSDRLRHVYKSRFFTEPEVSESVLELVDCIWKEAVGHIEDVLIKPVQQFTLEEIDRAEGILIELRNLLEEGENILSSNYIDVVHEFNSLIPLQSNVIENKRDISNRQDMCQLMRDMIAVNEATNWSIQCGRRVKYNALRCLIQPLSPASLEYTSISKLVTKDKNGDKDIHIENIFAVCRSVEESNFDVSLDNEMLLFHASSVKNFLGILSRGLLLPKIVVDDFGGKRTDAGMLGSGIYFSNSAETSSRYSSPYVHVDRGSRLMLVNNVALGKCQDMYNFETHLKSAPDGFHSVHGVKKSNNNQSEFKDNEYVVYKTSQQCMKYLVEFSLPGDKVNFKPLVEDEAILQEYDHGSTCTPESLDVFESKVNKAKDPNTDIQTGLVSVSDSPVPLKSVHVRAKLVDLAAQVVVFQSYTNDSMQPIEAKYVFPLEEMAAVCGFEAFINDKHIIGEVKEKETAHREYRKAISEGHGAYLMDQDVETPNVFTVSVGNLPPWATVVIKITYVSEIQVDQELICFEIPGSVAPWTKDKAFTQTTQKDVKTIGVNEERQAVSIKASIVMPFDIKKIVCPTHKIRMKKTVSKAVVEMVENQLLGDGFQLHIGLAEIHVPRMWIEKDPDDSTSWACMLTFYPEFEAASMSDYEAVILLDMSNSMIGDTLLEAKMVALMLVDNLPDTCTFNIVVFGTTFKELFPCSVTKSKGTTKIAREFIKKLCDNLGNTEVYQVLESYMLLDVEHTRNIFLISDGHINNSDQLLNCTQHHRNIRTFTCGVSSMGNRHMLRSISKNGAGCFEFFDSKTKSTWKRRVNTLLTNASQPALTSVSVDWKTHENRDIIQAPATITSLFSGARQVVYGFMYNCTQASLQAEINGQLVSTLVSTSELNITTGKVLHQLTAKALIQDWEDGILNEDKLKHEMTKKKYKDYIIATSKRFSIVTQFTSFIAIEDRTKEKDHLELTPSIKELVNKENVDILSYIGWDDQENVFKKSTDDVQPIVVEKEMEESEKKSQFIHSLEVMHSRKAMSLRPRLRKKTHVHLGNHLQDSTYSSSPNLLPNFYTSILPMSSISVEKPRRALLAEAPPTPSFDAKSYKASLPPDSAFGLIGRSPKRQLQEFMQSEPSPAPQPGSCFAFETIESTDRFMPPTGSSPPPPFQPKLASSRLKMSKGFSSAPRRSAPPAPIPPAPKLEQAFSGCGVESIRALAHTFIPPTKDTQGQTSPPLLLTPTCISFRISLDLDDDYCETVTPYQSMDEDEREYNEHNSVPKIAEKYKKKHVCSMKLDGAPSVSHMTHIQGKLSTSPDSKIYWDKLVVSQRHDEGLLQSGYWSLVEHSNILDEILNINCMKIIDTLIQAGVKSLGKHVESDIYKLVGTLITVTAISKVLFDNDLLRSTTDEAFVSDFNGQFVALTASIANNVRTAVIAALDTLHKFHHLYSYVCDTLELGHTWTDMCGSILGCDVTVIKRVMKKWIPSSHIG